MSPKTLLVYEKMSGHAGATYSQVHEAIKVGRAWYVPMAYGYESDEILLSKFSEKEFFEKFSETYSSGLK